MSTRQTTTTMGRLNKNQQVVVIGLTAATVVGLLYTYYWYQTNTRTGTSKQGAKGGTTTTTTRSDDETTKSSSKDSTTTTTSKAGADVPPDNNKTDSKTMTDDKTPLVKNTKQDERTLHVRIEELDKKGKALFKNKQVSLNYIHLQYCSSLEKCVRLVLVPRHTLTLHTTCTQHNTHKPRVHSTWPPRKFSPMHST